ncbi:hypothetical protein Phage2-1_00006 [Achromobacter phage 2-1]|nr:hypothetical protein Phage2-1_00006 [Achromobacter phage 2-1]
MPSSPSEEQEMSYHYPELGERAEWALGIIATLGTENADYFTHQDCPYEGRTLILLQAMCQTHKEPPQAAVPTTVSDDEVASIDTTLEHDLLAVLKDLKHHGASLTNVDQTEKMSYFRTITSLLEKLTMLRERAVGVKQVKEFEGAVLGVMEDVLTPEQRTQVMDGLRSILSKGRNEPVDLSTVEE